METLGGGEETENTEPEPDACHKIFDRCYERITPEAVQGIARTPDLPDYVYDDSTTMEELYNDCQRRVLELHDKHYAALAQSDPEAVGKHRQDVSAQIEGMKAYHDTLEEQGKVDSESRKIFTSSLLNLKTYRRPLYNLMVENPELPLEKEVQDQIESRYIEAIDKLFDSYPETNRSKSAGGEQYYFNSAKLTELTEHRVYVSSDVHKDPARVVSIWANTLAQTGRSLDFHYKFFRDAVSDNRLETIVCYLDKNTDREGVVEVLNNFIENCPPELLNDYIPSANSVTKGVSFVEEPIQLEYIFEVTGLRMSWTELVTAYLGLGIKDALRKGIDSNSTEYSKHIGKIFREMVTLSGLNPTSMTRSKSGLTPDWVGKISKAPEAAN